MDPIGLVAVLCVFGIPLSAIWTSHKRQMMEMQLKMHGQGNLNNSTVEALREEVRALREASNTALQYDLSFDAAMQRIEQRMENMEHRVGQVEANDSTLRVGR